MADLILVDDDPALRKMLADYFAGGPHRLRLARNSAECDALLRLAPADLLLLDRGLPGEDGLAIARRLRAGANPPAIIMLTGAGALDARIEGLAVADDYVAKPFSLAELAARVDALLRRRQSDLSFGPLRVDRAAWRVSGPDGPLDLSPTEVDLIAAFASRPDVPLTRDDLLRLAPARDDPEDRSIDSRVARLRRKLEALGCGDPIRTLRGLGYIYHTRG